MIFSFHFYFSYMKMPPHNTTALGHRIKKKKPKAKLLILEVQPTYEGTKVSDDKLPAAEEKEEEHCQKHQLIVSFFLPGHFSLRGQPLK